MFVEPDTTMRAGAQVLLPSVVSTLGEGAHGPLLNDGIIEAYGCDCWLKRVHESGPTGLYLELRV